MKSLGNKCIFTIYIQSVNVVRMEENCTENNLNERVNVWHQSL